MTDNPIYLPKGLGKDDPEISDEFEEGATLVFGLGPSRLDLEHSKAAAKVAKYISHDERIENTISIIARRLYLRTGAYNAEKIAEEWDDTVSVVPTVEFIRDYTATAAFKSKLDKIGGLERNGITAAQEALISTLISPDNRSLTFKLKKHKIPWVTFQGWLQQPKFMEQLTLSAEQALEASKAFSLIQLVRKVNQGEQKAIDTALAMTGRWDPTNRKQVDAQKLVQVILSVIDSEVTDPDTRDRIGRKLAILSTEAAVADSSTISGEIENGQHNP